MANLAKYKKDIIYKGKKFRVYGIGWLAFLVHRTPWTVRWWERKGILPKPILNLNGPTRWYLPDELTGYAKIYRKANVVAGTPIEKTSFKRDAFEYKSRLVAALKDSNKMEKMNAIIPNDVAIETALSVAHAIGEPQI